VHSRTYGVPRPVAPDELKVRTVQWDRHWRGHYYSHCN